MITEPVDERESAVGAGGVNQPAGRFIDDQKRDVFQHDRGIHKRRLVQRVVWVEAEDSRCVGWGDGVRRWDEGKGVGQAVRQNLADKKVSGLSGGKEWIAGEPWSADQKDWMGSGCGYRIDSKSGEREGGFFNRASRSVLGEFHVGSEVAGKKNSGGEEIESSNLLVSSALGCSS